MTARRDGGSVRSTAAIFTPREGDLCSAFGPPPFGRQCPALVQLRRPGRSGREMTTEI